MPPPSESNPPDFDEVRRRADEFARHAYPDVFARFERLAAVMMSMFPLSLPSLNESTTARKKSSSRPAGSLSVIRSIRAPWNSGWWDARL